MKFLEVRRCRLPVACFCALSLSATLAFTAPARACNVPVFRYALERWPAWWFQAVVFHKDKLSAAQQAAVQLLRDAGDATPAQANVKVDLVDLDAAPAKELVALYKSLTTKALPALTVLFPAESRIDAPFWSGPLTAANVQALLASPARQQLAKDILKGTSAVWVFLMCGDKQKDDAAAQMLKKQLPHLEKSLKLPKLTDDPEDQLDHKHLPLKLNFSTLELDRHDPAESVLVEMLLNSEPAKGGEPALRTYNEPMVFPVYGRGRAMFALVGGGITEENLLDAAKFVIGPCTCKVKELNPGFDLLMNIAWDSALSERLVKDVELPPLSGIPGIKQPTAPANQKASSASGPPVTAHSTESSPAPKLLRKDPGNTLFRNSLLAIAAGMVIVGLVYVVSRVRGTWEAK